jgi:hypothetical protein
MKLTLALLSEREELLSSISAASREIDIKRRRVTQIEAVAEAALSDAAELVKGSFRITWIFVKMRVHWKDAFIARCGANAAQELQDGTATTKQIKITRTNK